MLLPLLAAAVLHQFVVLGPGGSAVARAVVAGEAAGCPAVSVDEVATPMRVRFAGGPGWPITVCEVEVTAARRASIGGAALPLPKPEPARIAFLGDSGCRVKSNGDGSITAQDCKGGGWPFARIASAVAAARPDLVIHAGDYVYRKAACPEASASRCGGSPHGPGWAALEADFFSPAQPLLAAAPLVVPRGNHETCRPRASRASLGGVGFFLLLDPRPLAEVVDATRLAAYLRWLAAEADGGDDEEEEELPAAACAEWTPAYAVAAGAALDLWVLDSNQPADGAAQLEKHPELAARYAAELQRLQQATLAGKRAWLLSHRPLYGLSPGSRSRPSAGRTQLNATLQAAFERAGRPGAIDLALAGHMHLFQAVAFDDASRPPTLTAGTAGTQLDDFGAWPELVDPSLAPYLVAGDAEHPAKVHGLTASQFGFVLLQPGAQGLVRAELRGPDGAARIACELRGRALQCKPAGR